MDLARCRVYGQSLPGTGVRAHPRTLVLILGLCLWPAGCRYLDSSVTETEIHVVTEPVTPLAAALEVDRNDLGNSWGIHQIAVSLRYFPRVVHASTSTLPPRAMRRLLVQRSLCVSAPCHRRLQFAPHPAHCSLFTEATIARRCRCPAEPGCLRPMPPARASVRRSLSYARRSFPLPCVAWPKNAIAFLSDQSMPHRNICISSVPVDKAGRAARAYSFSMSALDFSRGRCGFGAAIPGCT